MVSGYFNPNLFWLTLNHSNKEGMWNLPENAAKHPTFTFDVEVSFGMFLKYLVFS